MIPEQSLNLSGKVALISGAGVGIGRAVALALGKAGAIIGLHYYSSADSAHQLFDELTALDIKAVLLPADLTKESDANAMVDKLVEDTGRLDIVVNNSGGLVKRATIEDCTLENWGPRYFGVTQNPKVSNSLNIEGGDRSDISTHHLFQPPQVFPWVGVS